MAITQQRDFLTQLPPFDQLDKPVLNELADGMNVVYLPQSTNLILGKEGQADSLYILIKGKVAELQEGAIISHYSVRGFFGDSEMLGKSSKVTVYEVLEETIAYTLPSSLFLKAFESCTQFARFFNASIVEKLNRIHQSIQSASSTEVMMETVCSAHIQECVSVDKQASLLEVSQKMTQARSDACLVNFDDESVGIVTTSDILKFVATEPHDLLTQTGVLSQVANRPVYSVHEFDYLFNALLKMTRYQIDRLVVRRDEGFIGFLHQKDLMSLFANQSGLVLLNVDQAESMQDLVTVGPQIDQLINSLNRKGIKTHYIAKLVNELHRKMIYKLIEFILPVELRDKVCILVMGSEGRSEQVIRTDQDNALIYRDDVSTEEIEKIQYFANSFTQAMQEIGFPPCPGNIMLSNNEWCLSISAFKSKIDRWFNKPSEESFMHAAILLDAECVYGKNRWLQEIKQALREKQDEYPVFLRHFAISVLQFNTPIGFFWWLSHPCR